MSETLSRDEIDCRVAEIERSSIVLWGDDTGFGLTLPHGCDITGSLDEIDGVVGTSLYTFDVDHNLTRRGIGERLLKCFFAYSHNRHAEYVTSSIISPTALRMRRKLFGEATLHFMEIVDGVETELPISVDQACMSIDRANDLQTKSDKEGVYADIDIGFEVIVSLNEVNQDVIQWELPIS